MKMLNFANRNTKEMLRDPLMFIFALGFPLVLLVLMSVINASIPVDLFAIENLAPGIAVFGLSFVSLLSGTLLATDRTTAFLSRLFSTPMTSADFIFGYILPSLLLSFLQTLICYAASLFFGLEFSAKILFSAVVSIPSALLFVSIGLCLGCLVSEKAVGGLSSVIINLAAWLSGIWFDIGLIGGVFEKICNILPFIHAKESVAAALNGNFSDILPHLLWVGGYAVVFTVLSVVLFKKKMK